MTWPEAVVAVAFVVSGVGGMLTMIWIVERNR